MYAVAHQYHLGSWPARLSGCQASSLPSLGGVAGGLIQGVPG